MTLRFVVFGGKMALKGGGYMSKIVTKEKLDLMKVKAGYYSSESLSSKEQKECRKLIADG